MLRYLRRGRQPHPHERRHLGRALSRPVSIPNANGIHTRIDTHACTTLRIPYPRPKMTPHIRLPAVWIHRKDMYRPPPRGERHEAPVSRASYALYDRACARATQCVQVRGRGRFRRQLTYRRGTQSPDARPEALAPHDEEPRAVTRECQRTDGGTPCLEYMHVSYSSSSSASSLRRSTTAQKRHEIHDSYPRAHLTSRSTNSGCRE
ncbi:hypothetical protein DFH09DRAFT_1157992 [Mycena vulgaris]|nr:hypothetical protein DFH09DRAFT_1157992 [Mycena vulgaris]